MRSIISSVWTGKAGDETYLLKFRSSMRIAQVLIRMTLQCQLPVSVFNLCFLGLSPYFQDVVEGPRRSHDGPRGTRSMRSGKRGSPLSILFEKCTTYKIYTSALKSHRRRLQLAHCQGKYSYGLRYLTSAACRWQIISAHFHRPIANQACPLKPSCSACKCHNPTPRAGKLSQGKHHFTSPDRRDSPIFCGSRIATS